MRNGTVPGSQSTIKGEYDERAQKDLPVYGGQIRINCRRKTITAQDKEALDFLVEHAFAM